MTLNANSPGAVRMAPLRRLDGTERGLDALVGAVILVAELMIGLIAIFALYETGMAASATDPGASEAINAGFLIALFGSGIVVLITTIVFLGRVIAGRRSWPAPLWGTILMTVALVVGYFVMVGEL
ncbi:MAG: hypothetical protein KKH51_06355 [Actinobacteria bacterium]|nr:hypothetical protein [Actinomycetota bacterium]